MEVSFCKCGVKPPHIRLVVNDDGNKTCSRPYFSQEAVLRDYAMMSRQKLGISPRIDDSREVHEIFKGVFSKFPEIEKEYKELEALIDVPELAKTEKEAWDSLPEEEKQIVRDFCTKGFSSVEKKHWPGDLFGSNESACISGKNPPDNPSAKCHIVSMLYSPIDHPDTLDD